MATILAITTLLWILNFPPVFGLGGFFIWVLARSYHVDSNDLTAGLLDLAHLAEEVPES